MSKKTKWVISILIVLSVVTVVSAQDMSKRYLPFVFKAPPATATPTPTNTPQVTSTPTITPTPEASVLIDEVVNGLTSSDLLDENVLIDNNSSRNVDMSDWMLRGEGPEIFTFPDGFTLNSGASVRVWTKGGTDSSGNLYWGLSSPVWSNGGECAILRDEDNERVDQLCYRPGDND